MAESKMTPKSRPVVWKVKCGKRSESKAWSNLRSCWGVPNHMSWVLAEFKESLFEDIQELRSFESCSILLVRRSWLEGPWTYAWISSAKRWPCYQRRSSYHWYMYFSLRIVSFAMFDEHVGENTNIAMVKKLYPPNPLSSRHVARKESELISIWKKFLALLVMKSLNLLSGIVDWSFGGSSFPTWLSPSTITLFSEASTSLSKRVNATNFSLRYLSWTHSRAEPSTKFCRVPSISGRFCRVSSTDSEYLTKCNFFQMY